METTNDTMMIKPQLSRAAGLDIHKKKIVVCYLPLIGVFSPTNMFVVGEKIRTAG